MRGIAGLMAAVWIAGPALAELTEVDLTQPGDGLITRDSINALDWLDLTETTSLSFEAVRDGAGGWTAQGFRHATGVELCQLFDEAGAVSLTCAKPISQTAFVPREDATFLLGLVGVTDPDGDDDIDERSVGYFDPEDEGSAGSTGGGFVNVTPDSGQVILFPAQLGATFESATVGSWLVRPAPLICGDGSIVGSETCDDGNQMAGDGCDASCQVEVGSDCRGQPSVCEAILCGDGIVSVPEEGCDDGNEVGEDGCDAGCQIEVGFECSGEPSICAEVCGDGVVTGSEGCDDGNDAVSDGCDEVCQVEVGFDCAGEPSVCTEVCGDGIVTALAQACDDGNAQAGDGCSNTCRVEFGFECTGEPSVCTATCGDGFVTSVEGCDDGNEMAGDGCDGSCQVEAGFACQVEPNVCTLLIDECEGADLISSFPFSEQVDTTLATAAGSDASSSCGEGADGATVWYRIETSQDSSVTVRTDESDYDTILTLYTGTCASPTEIACNDDEGDDMALARPGPQLRAAGSSRLDFMAETGTTYRLRVGARNSGAGGNLVLAAALPEPGRGALALAAIAALAWLRRR